MEATLDLAWSSQINMIVILKIKQFPSCKHVNGSDHNGKMWFC